MITTTETYNPYSIIRNVDMKIQFNASNQGALNNASFNSSYSDNISNFNQLKNSEYTQKNMQRAKITILYLTEKANFYHKQ